MKKKKKKAGVLKDLNQRLLQMICTVAKTADSSLTSYFPNAYYMPGSVLNPFTLLTFLTVIKIQ